MKKFLVFCSLVGLLLAGDGYSQTPEGFDANANFSGADTHMFRSFDNRYQGVQGEPTLFPKALKGSVKLQGGDVAANQDLNYDAIADELLVDSKKLKKIVVVRTEMVESFTIEETDDSPEMKFVKMVRPSSKPGYYQVLYDGKTGLYKKHFKIVEKANYGGAYNSNAKRYDEFVSSNKYFIVNGEKGLEEIKLTKKSLEAFFDKNEEFSSYVKKEKPNLKREEDVIALLTYLDSK